MAAYRRTEYRILPDGSVSVSVLDGEGESCLLITADAEAALGQVQERRLKPEFAGELEVEPGLSVQARSKL
ncbi:MAG: DUF2997 domain-containing protein [Thermostichales cyanobacterium SZTDM-1c_bins_54]